MVVVPPCGVMALGTGKAKALAAWGSQGFADAIRWIGCVSRRAGAGPALMF